MGITLDDPGLSLFFANAGMEPVKMVGELIGITCPSCGDSGHEDMFCRHCGYAKFHIESRGAHKGAFVINCKIMITTVEDD